MAHWLLLEKYLADDFLDYIVILVSSDLICVIVITLLYRARLNHFYVVA